MKTQLSTIFQRTYFFTININLLIYNIMINEHKQRILTLGQDSIKKETEKLLSKLNELTIHTDKDSKSKIISECDEIISEINKQLTKLKSKSLEKE